MIRLMTMVMLVKVMRKSCARLSPSAVDVSSANGLHDDGRTGHDQSDHHDVRSLSPSSLSLSTSPSSSLSSSFVMAILIVERIPHGCVWPSCPSSGPPMSSQRSSPPLSAAPPNNDNTSTGVRSNLFGQLLDDVGW